MPLLDEIRDALKRDDFSNARRSLKAYLLSNGLEPQQLTWARQKLALSTYKDKEIQSEPALEEALGVLKQEGLPTSTDPETLGLAGAVHKRLWEISRDTRHLSKSSEYYERTRLAGEGSGNLEKEAYGAVNAAYVLDLLAAEEDAKASVHRARADDLRQKVCDKSGEIVKVEDPNDAWWLRASLIEALFGLGQSEQAKALLEESLTRFNPQEWQRESMGRQLANIARLRYGPDKFAAAFGALKALASEDAARALLIGKVGLALSGGGFRAALFHVGVLARLAELDVLRHVEVLSCVSGGSILGALYYLELRRELMNRRDGDMSRDVYIEIVERVQDKLIGALRKDIRTRAMLMSLPSLLSRRTILTGKMIDQALYADCGAPNRCLKELTIQPAAEPQSFHPRRNNWRQSAKVPMLIINATTLNTGHNWQFTASYMGEAPTCIEPAIDASERFRRMYYREAPLPHGDIKLQTAVAASAAVPGIFRPIKLKGLYPNRTVRLSDGGVHDNQGLFGLVEQDCNILIVSDGCGQLNSEPRPARLALGVLGRTTNVLMETVRRNSYRLSAQQFHNKRIRAFHFIHLKRGLSTRDITWIRGRPGAARAVPDDSEQTKLDRQTQRALASIRTDLDTFSENECLALMFAGYRIASRDFDGSEIFKHAPQDVRWKFLRMSALMDEATAASAPPAFIEELECGRYLFFRRIRLSWLGRVWRRLRPKPDPEE